MLSILIPVHNYVVVPLVRALLTQSTHLKLPCEIVCLDDGSDEFHKAQNSILKGLASNVVYDELPQNVGRSRIRNLLSAKAKYNNLLFLDCDAVLQDDEYLINYLPFLDAGKVVCGGRIVPFSPHITDEQHLRWLYSLWRECRPANIRNKQPYFGFVSNNFLIPKDVALLVPFDETLHGYGHEDTVFGHALRRSGVPLVHIDNPISYAQYDNANEFLDKTLNALNNLRIIGQRPDFKDDTEFKKSVRLVNIANKLKRFGLDGFVSGILNRRWLKRQMERNLKGPNPDLTVFDLWRLAHWLEPKAD
jgi:glycosyltransferase involved in cell wall biosynthesis